ncbi:hypothetical protein Fokcrypt_00049 [Candidatus Fokinia cryptica]|uniref:Uncharacterized protein n=1 Tax=Candidatus Fokinia crypta TaxID=1920990 RepID=A0ABZ0URA6_9RICK|nr:hypothetical protein Fokcrypt_00049 [Candidatus Fokinia cryptica]
MDFFPSCGIIVMSDGEAAIEKMELTVCMACQLLLIKWNL